MNVLLHHWMSIKRLDLILLIQSNHPIKAVTTCNNKKNKASPALWSHLLSPKTLWKCDISHHVTGGLPTNLKNIIILVIMKIHQSD